MAPSPCPVLLYSSCPWADKSIGIIKMIVDCTLYIFYKSHLVVLSGNLKKCSFQSAIYIMCILHQKGFSISHLKEIQYLTLKSKFSTLHLKAIQYLKLINKFSVCVCVNVYIFWRRCLRYRNFYLVFYRTFGSTVD
jgi:hypothetical protein